MSVAAAREVDLSAYLALVALSVVSLAIAGVIRRVWRRRATAPQRLRAGSSVLPLLAVFIAGLIVYLLAALAVEKFWVRNHRGASTDDILQSDTGAALLSTIPPILALVLMLAGDAAIFPAIRQRLGMSLRRLPAGLLWGIAGTVIVVPPLFLLSQLMELVYRQVHYQHPAEHPLLHALGEERSRVAGIAIIIGACVIAPLWEELLFRGHLQTLTQCAMRRLLARGTVRSQNTRVWADWSAILLTSWLFMWMHPLWSWPIIFLLAICLGYTYERTGNLWVCITMHALFNSSMTAMFLLSGSAQ